MTHLITELGAAESDMFDLTAFSIHSSATNDPHICLGAFVFEQNQEPIPTSCGVSRGKAYKKQGSKNEKILLCSRFQGCEVSEHVCEAAHHEEQTEASSMSPDNCKETVVP